MSVLYRPHRGGRKESDAEAKEYNDIEDMKENIIKDFYTEKYFDKEDVVIHSRLAPYSETEYVHMVCVKQFAGEVYDYPQCIGYMEEIN